MTDAKKRTNNRYRATAKGKAADRRYATSAKRRLAMALRRKERTKQYRLWLDTFKNAPCLDCGHIFPPECMDLDHRDSTTKKFEVGHGMVHSERAVLAEIAKCDLVCSNCHRIRTRKRKLLA